MIKEKSKKEVIQEAQKLRRAAHYAALKDICFFFSIRKTRSSKKLLKPRGKVDRKQNLFFCVCVDDIKMIGRTHNLNPLLKKLMKLVDLGEPTSFLDHVYLGWTQRECKTNESIVEECKNMFESRISAGATGKLLAW